MGLSGWTAACLSAMLAPALACCTPRCDGLGEWSGYLNPPEEYLAFERRCDRIGAYERDGILIEEYRQANGPGTYQRLMLAFPRSAKGRLPAVIAPFYYPEAMLGFNPKTGGVECELTSPNTNLTYFSAISYMSDLARRGYATASAEAYHITYDRKGAPSSSWGMWGHSGGKLMKDCPGWTGVGKLLFDTRLVIDFVAADPRVSPDRIGIIGHSLGGKMAFYAGCVDPRIKVMVASDFGIGWDQTNWKDVWYWGRKLDEVRAKGLDHSDLLSLSGGKPFCLIAGKYDNADSGAMMRRAKGYEGHPERLVLINHATGHRPPRDATEAGYRFLDRYLQR